MEKTKTSSSSWIDLLRLLLNQQSPKQRIAIVGIGNTLRSDDAAGILVVRALLRTPLIQHLETISLIDAGYAPENCTSDLRCFDPDMILLIDAAEMDEAPGTIRWIEIDEINGMGSSTHTLPLSMLAKYLTLELNSQIALLGIQPQSNEVGGTVSSSVKDAVNTVVEDLTEFLSRPGVI